MVQERQDAWAEGVGYLERETFMAFLSLPPPQRKIVREVILAFARAHASHAPAADTPEPNADAPSDDTP